MSKKLYEMVKQGKYTAQDRPQDDEFKNFDRESLILLIEAQKERIGELLADRPQGEWIPCSERLPENGHYYLWCSDMGNVQSDYYWNGFEKEQKYGYNIVAWMPLPKSWKGADDAD